MEKDLYRSQFRLPQSLYERLKSAADKNRRSVNAELVARLEGSFTPGVPSAQFADLLVTNFDKLVREAIERAGQESTFDELTSFSKSLTKDN